jgi:hypothetical protein
MGAWALASIADCGMDCCKPNEWASSGAPSYEAPSCCDTADTTCGFEAGTVEELFDEVVCCFNSAGGYHLSITTINASADDFVDVDPRTHARTLHAPHSDLPDTPLYLSNAAFLC